MRFWRVFILIWMMVWTIIIIPGHTRGKIPLVGPICPSCQADDKEVPFFFGQLPSCCAKKQVGSHEGTPFKKTSGNCAICSVAATMSCETVAPPLQLELGLLEVLAHERLVPAVTVEIFLAYNSRGPPAVM